MVRVEHYGKGAPSWSRQFECPRPVPAVTGAFISVDRDWFETLGGFNEDYLFGHYEDADLSLRSLIRGKPVWVHDFPLWHLEGKGSVRRPPHEGGSMVNRWLFSQLWGDLITRDLAGPSALSNAMQAARIAAARPEAKPAKTSKRR
jgi:GT2 family glycosyltransferase